MRFRSFFRTLAVNSVSDFFRKTQHCVWCLPNCAHTEVERIRQNFVFDVYQANVTSKDDTNRHERGKAQRSLSACHVLKRSFFCVCVVFFFNSETTTARPSQHWTSKKTCTLSWFFKIRKRKKRKEPKNDNTQTLKVIIYLIKQNKRLNFFPLPLHAATTLDDKVKCNWPLATLWLTNQLQLISTCQQTLLLTQSPPPPPIFFPQKLFTFHNCIVPMGFLP